MSAREEHKSLSKVQGYFLQTIMAPRRGGGDSFDGGGGGIGISCSGCNEALFLVGDEWTVGYCPLLKSVPKHFE
jgi:hypothetical protein